MTLGRPKGTYEPERELKPHGTMAARARHRHRGEPYCPACAAIVTPRNQGNTWKQQWTKPKAALTLRPKFRACSGCGARGSVNPHLKIKEFLCPECR
jgi:hypothetical protein